MKVYRGITQKNGSTPCALVIGNFDGVHLGHQTLVARVREAAARLHVAASLLTFHPHPRQYFAMKRGSMQDAPVTLTPLREKVLALKESGLDELIIARFNSYIAALSPEEFVKNILVDGLNAKWVMVGEAFMFGKGRSGTTDDLIAFGKRYGFDVEILKTVEDTAGDRISSSNVRAALEASDFDRVRILTGRPYRLSGHITHGEKLGRTMGFPTANIKVRHYNPALSGVFVTRVHGLKDHPVEAVSMIGVRPTFDGTPAALETHFFEECGDCYGKLISVEFVKKLRDNRKFPSIDALKDAISKDVADAKAWFASQH